MAIYKETFERLDHNTHNNIMRRASETKVKKENTLLTTNNLGYPLTNDKIKITFKAFVSSKL